MTASPNPATSDLDRTTREIVITRLLNAPRELAFSAWTDPEKVVKWWGPNGFYDDHRTDGRPPRRRLEVRDARPGRRRLPE